MRPDPVFIIGMHRSGTSALGGVLESLGLTVGKTVMPPNAAEGNPKGFSENLALMQFHDRFLESVKSIWWDCRRFAQAGFPEGRRGDSRRNCCNYSWTNSARAAH